MHSHVSLALFFFFFFFFFSPRTYYYYSTNRYELKPVKHAAALGAST